ncbi:hypothetical protein JAAARDRAFT_42738 [Jaapia argillacea MUCL 33604]|uniref:Protein kinase domain-containing protein n=1 Tax=Jaapia argillacea MUCL 33604 TaxID=933084 RepID=A0A067P6X4_9AGAM|nr:hypothetical protein JAAARDRAFT_42738 [Jaapia argillacea MUCL 33604]
MSKCPQCHASYGQVSRLGPHGSFVARDTGDPLVDAPACSDLIVPSEISTQPVDIVTTRGAGSGYEESSQQEFISTSTEEDLYPARIVTQTQASVLAINVPNPGGLTLPLTDTGYTNPDETESPTRSPVSPIAETYNNISPSGDILPFSGFTDLSNSVTIVGDRPLSGGASCDVYAGELEWNGVRTKVAMKRIRIFRDCTDSHRAKSWKLFRREAKIWSRFRHPFVLPFLGFARFGDVDLFLISPWASRGNCIQYLEVNSTASRPRIASQVADALEYLHSGNAPSGYVHGDLKGDNVLISDAGNALLCDFGLSRCVEGIASITRTPTGIDAFGNICFAAPELFNAGDARPTLWSDVFAFGCLLIQIFTGHRPYRDLTERQVMGAIMRGVKPERPREPCVVAAGLNDGLWELVDRCLDHQAALRPSMAEVARRLKRHQLELHPGNRSE